MTFTFYAYNETDKPPADLSLRCNPNVVPVLCGLHKACRSHPLTECGAQDGNETFMNLFGDNEPTIAEDFANWVKIADRTYIYDYTINFLNTAQFFSNLETMQPTMKYMHDIGITGYVYNCGDGHYAAFNEQVVNRILDDLVAAIGLPKERLCTYCWDGKDVSCPGCCPGCPKKQLDK